MFLFFSSSAVSHTRHIPVSLCMGKLICRENSQRWVCWCKGCAFVIVIHRLAQLGRWTQRCMCCSPIIVSCGDLTSCTCPRRWGSICFPTATPAQCIIKHLDFCQVNGQKLASWYSQMLVIAGCLIICMPFRNRTGDHPSLSFRAVGHSSWWPLKLHLFLESTAPMTQGKAEEGASRSFLGLPMSCLLAPVPATQRRGRRAPSCQVARSSGWPWPGLLCGAHPSSSWTKPRVPWMQRASTW